MSGPVPDLIAAAQAIPPAVALGAAAIAWPAWRAAVRFVDAVWRRWGDHPLTALAGFVAPVVGGAPACVLVVFAFGLGADAVAHLDRPRCVIERFKPDGTSAGVLFLDGPCPTDGGP